MSFSCTVSIDSPSLTSADIHVYNSLWYEYAMVQMNIDGGVLLAKLLAPEWLECFCRFIDGEIVEFDEVLLKSGDLFRAVKMPGSIIRWFVFDYISGKEVALDLDDQACKLLHHAVLWAFINALRNGVGGEELKIRGLEVLIPAAWTEVRQEKA